MNNKEQSYELIKFKDGDFSLDVKVSPDEDTVWLTQKEMALLFDVDRTRITRHIDSILKSRELPISVCAEKHILHLMAKLIILSIIILI